MNSSIKNYLGIAGILTILLMGWSAYRFVGAYSESILPSSFRSFTATAEGKVVAIPDVAEFSFGVLTEGATARVSAAGRERSRRDPDLRRLAVARPSAAPLSAVPVAPVFVSASPAGPALSGTS